MIKDIEFDTFPKLLTRNYKEHPDVLAMAQVDFGIWQSHTWKECYANVKYFSLGLISLGLGKNDKAVIMGENEPEWFWAQVAIQAAGAWPAGIFVDMVPDEVKYITEHSDARFAIVDDQEQVDKFIAIKDQVPKLEKVIFWDARGLGHYKQPYLLSFSKVLELGREYEKSHPELFEHNVAGQQAEEIAQVYYTSGTSGLPKAALLSHHALISSGRAFLLFNPLHPGDQMVSLFPAPWIGEGLFTTNSHMIAGVALNFAEEPETIHDDLRDVAPNAVLYGPRQWESEIRSIQVKIDEAGFLKKLTYKLFFPVGSIRARLIRDKMGINPFWRLLIAMGKVALFQPLLDKIGLSKCRIALTGSAAMSIDTFKMLSALGLNLKQVYASTEGGFIAGHTPNDIRFETVGTVAMNYNVRINNDSEIMAKGPGLFSGYYKDPVKTKESIDDKGWFHTGDAGYLDQEGHLVFMDRMSDMVELKNGIRYAPQYVEGRLRFCPYIQDVMALGDKDKDYIGVLVIISFENVGRWAEVNHLNYTTFVDLSQKAEVARLILPEIKRINDSLKNISKDLQIKRYVLLHKEFDADESELTRTRKLRRNFMSERYGDIINALYEGKTDFNVEASVTYRDGRKGTIKTQLKIWTVE